ncbi:LPS export ABC transporter periplasmic protein LptC [Cognatishimia sp. SS12]|uniref:LPS export ABC transporter periplasmic protein LptC n=1 Tax=Cognatishimia sp. SS12 TaxID=2979465 RepID=UPI00232EF0FE|nr:LPS export ABC transporter periplasmic protein LptC [Cognatishimia sp. SS12]MDC0737670.1 LPS export ABC transporter periplasmic protein LptC [Cognatishimia sp. SS12]
MARRGLTYSRVIAWLKVGLPVIALALLSTMFLFSRSNAPSGALPFADFELEERARDQRITAPFFAGQTSAGYDISVKADFAQPGLKDPRLTEAQSVAATIKLADGNIVDLNAQSAEVDSLNRLADLSGVVTITSSNGYKMVTESLALNMDAGSATSETEVQGTGPAGTFTAGAMELLNPPEGENSRFLFTNGVKLVYTPAKE